MKQSKTILEKQALQLSLDDLLGKQSVRTTFKLPPQIIELLSITAAQLGIKQKSLFDQLVEDTSVLREIAKEAQDTTDKEKERRPKTFVISRNSLISIEAICQNVQVSRDKLVEASIKRLMPVIDNERKKNEKRKIMLKEMQALLQQAKKLQGKAAKLLEKDDQVYELIKNQTSLCQKNVAAVEVLVEKGKSMEVW